MEYIGLEMPFDEAENYLLPSNKQKLDRFFFKDDNYQKLQKETTYYIIGDKGSGKTTYSVYFCNNTIEGNIKSKRYVLSVDDYNKLIFMKKDHKLDYTNYLTLWKAIILIKLFSSLNENEISKWGSRCYSSIVKLLEEYNFTSFTSDTFSPVSFMDSASFQAGITAGIATAQGNASADLKEMKSRKVKTEKGVYNDSWVRFINIISNEMQSLKLKNHHYLFIDGIDSRPLGITHDEYKECMFPLVRAVYEINTSILSKIKDRNKGRLQVILLSRLDIFMQSGLSNPGSKISDNSVFLQWGTIKEDDYSSSSIFSLVTNILNSNSSSEKLDWKSYFDYNLSFKGTSEYYPSFVYFLKMTTATPRDFVKYLRIIQDQCKAKGLNNPNKGVITSDLTLRAYSTYFAESIRTMLGFYYDAKAISNLFAFIKRIKKNRFLYSEIRNYYNGYPKKKELDEAFGDINTILKIMYDSNMICYIEEGPRYRWRYRECTMANYSLTLDDYLLVDNTKFKFHPALEKELGLY